MVEQGRHHREVFELLRPGIDLDAEREKRRAAGDEVELTGEDLYPDAIPRLEALRRAGYRVGLAGNQPAETGRLLAGLGLPVDMIATSAGWGVEKPSREFFARVVEAARVPAEDIAYVGDRLDNDVLPALEAGMVAVFVRRGPWGIVHARRPELARAHLRLETLAELPDALRALSFAPHPGGGTEPMDEP